jgi:hypothetical protein
MMPELEQALVERSEQGTPRGASAVWASAVRGDANEWSDRAVDADTVGTWTTPNFEGIGNTAAWDTYVAYDLAAPAERRWTWVAAVAVVILITGAALLAAGGFESDSAPADTPTSSVSIPTAEERAKGRAVWEEQFASGWVPYRNTDMETGEEIEGWARVHLTDTGAPDLQAQQAEAPPAMAGSGTAIYDSPDGRLIGYQLNSLGFVPLDRITDVNGAQARIDEYGCDPNAADMAEAKRCGDLLSPESKAGVPD